MVRFFYELFSELYLSMTIRKLTTLTFLLLLGGYALSQKTTDEEYAPPQKTEDKKKDKGEFKDRLTYGGNLGGYFGVNSFVQVNPMIGYKMNDWWVNGIGVNYMYFSQGPNNASIYGASVWSRAYIARQFFIHTELENLNLPRFNNFDSGRENVPVWLIGAGIQSNGFGIMVLYDIIGDPRSPYSTPVFRIGGMFGIGR